MYDYDRTAVTLSKTAAEKLPKDLVKSKYHREGFVENLDEYKAEAVLTPKAQGRAQQLLGSKWRDLKPSAVIRSLGKKTAAATLPKGQKALLESIAKDNDRGNRPRVPPIHSQALDGLLKKKLVTYSGGHASLTAEGKKALGKNEDCRC